MTGKINNVSNRGLPGAVKFKQQASLKKLTNEAIELSSQFNYFLGKLPTEVQDAYNAYKRLDKAEEKLYDLTEKADDGKIPYTEVTAQAQEVENLKKELAKLETKMPKNYKEIYDAIKNY